MDILSIDLQEYYTYCNSKYFNNILSPAEFINLKWNYNLGNVAGMCIKSFKDITIELNPIYLTIYPDEFGSILVHEMIHLISLEHDDIFLEEANRITKMGLPITINCKHDISNINEEWRDDDYE